jgi:hypothetical protein
MEEKMVKSTACQRRIEGRVMHEFKHGELRSGKADKVTNHEQAIAIALNEAGAAKYNTRPENHHNRAKNAQKDS